MIVAIITALAIHGLGDLVQLALLIRAFELGYRLGAGRHNAYRGVSLFAPRQGQDTGAKAKHKNGKGFHRASHRSNTARPDHERSKPSSEFALRFAATLVMQGRRKLGTIGLDDRRCLRAAPRRLGVQTGEYPAHSSRGHHAAAGSAWLDPFHAARFHQYPRPAKA